MCYNPDYESLIRAQSIVTDQGKVYVSAVKSNSRHYLTLLQEPHKSEVQHTIILRGREVKALYEMMKPFVEAYEKAIDKN